MSGLREKPVYVLPDLNGPSGNAFFMMAEVLGLLRKAGYTRGERAMIQDEMMSGGYDNVLDCIFRYCKVVQPTDYVFMERRDVKR